MRQTRLVKKRQLRVARERKTKPRTLAWTPLGSAGGGNGEVVHAQAQLEQRPLMSGNDD